MSGGNKIFVTGNKHLSADHSTDDASGNSTSGNAFQNISGNERPYYRDGRYWITILVIASLYVARMVMSIGLGAGIVTAQPELTTLAVFLIPILYLALNVSTEGGVSAAMWVLILSIPRIMAYYQERSYVGVWAQAMQVLVLAVIATLVGRQVSAERSARLRAEGSRRAHLAAEARYHSLFESNDSPIFLVSHSGKVLEVNPAAAKLFPGSNGNVGIDGDKENLELVRKRLHEYHGNLDLAAIVGQNAARELLALGSRAIGDAYPMLNTPPLDIPRKVMLLPDRAGSPGMEGSGINNDAQAMEGNIREDGRDGRTGDVSPSSSHLFHAPLSSVNGYDESSESRVIGIQDINRKDYFGGKDALGMRNDDDSVTEKAVPLVEIRSGEGIYLFRPSVTAIHDEYSQPILQVILEDVTSEAVSLKNAELYARKVLGAQEDERKRLAQELHDGPLQSLIHLCRQVDVVSGGVEGKQQELEQVREVAEGAVSELRSIARGLRPSILDDLGLVTAISRLLSELEERTGIKTTLGVHGMEWRPSPQVESCLFRVAQEALSNVERHSHATHVAVGLEAERGNLHFLVNDDGDGFEYGTVYSSPDHTMGLAGMRERVSSLGGRLYIRSTLRSRINGADALPKNTGTSIEVFVPYSTDYTGKASSQ